MNIFLYHEFWFCHLDISKNNLGHEHDFQRFTLQLAISYENIRQTSANMNDKHCLCIIFSAFLNTSTRLQTFKHFIAKNLLIPIYDTS